MKITVLAPDLSTNCLGRGLVLAEILAQDHEVRVMGSRFGNALWPPAVDHPVEIAQSPGGPWPGYLGAARSLMRDLAGDVVVAVKPRLPSLGLALLARWRGGAPVILDLDDEETALRPIPSRPLPLLGDLLNPDGGVSRKIMTRAIPQADALTTASMGLQRRHGGELVWHAKNTDLLSPREARREEWRGRLGLGEEPVVLFLGTPRPWKGVEDAADAVAGMNREATLLVVGGDDSTYCRRIGALPGVRLQGMVPLGDLPGFLEAADVVVIPQRWNSITRFQMPSKLFDAMAMAKPIVATKVSDMGLVLNGGRGITVSPGDVRAMRMALESILEDPEMGRTMGKKARAWCVANASLTSSRDAMKRALDGALAGRRT